MKSQWVFGYGSLVWRPAFPFAEQRPGYITGFWRRFWQGSTDHRGVPGAPGRVVTLVPARDAHTWGMAYRVEPDVLEEVLAQLDHREQGGYDRHELEVHDADHRSFATALVYLARPDNPNYLGEAPLADIAAQVRRSTGPSGPNPEYVLRLAEALDAMGVEDPHVDALAALVRRADHEA